MTELLTQLQYYFSYSFVRYALLAGVLVSLCAGLLGVNLVLKRFSMIGDGLSHVAFGAMCAAMVGSIAPMAVALPVTVIAAVLLLRVSTNTKIQGDSAIAMISVGSLALGYLLLNVFSVSPNLGGDVCGSLFGSTSILTLERGDVLLIAGLTLLVLLCYLLFGHRIFAVTFDEEFAKATGIRAERYNLLLAVISAVVIVLAMQLVGALLISALIVFPALSAMRLFRSYRGVMLCAVGFAVLCSVLGILISLFCSTPVGSTIVAVDIAVFLLCAAVGRLRGVS